MREITVAKKSFLISYVLLICFGWFGVHRFYLGKWFSGLIYLGTFGLLGLGVLLDLFTLPYLIKEANEPTEPTLPISFNLFKILFSSKSEELAPWATLPQSAILQFIDFIDNIARIVLFLVSPMLVLMFSLYISGSLQIAFFTIAILILAGYVGNIRQILDNFQHALVQTPALSRVPFLSDVVKNVSEFYSYYFTHKPLNVLLYLCYPALMFLSSVHKPFRDELNLYKNLLLIIVFTLVLDTLLSYSRVYQPYLSIFDAILSILFSLIMVSILLMTLLMPTITTSLKFRLSGKRKTLSLITTLALIFAFAGYQSNTIPLENYVTISDSFNLENKMKQSKFREDLTTQTEMFAFYHISRLTTPSIEIEPHTGLTTAYRKHIQSIAVPGENQAFTVFTFTQQEENQPFWLGVHYAVLEFGQINKPLILFMMNSDGVVYTQWNALPTAIQQRFTILDSQALKSIDEKTYSLRQVSQPMLIGDLP